MAHKKPGDKVWVNQGGKDKIGFFIRDGHDNDTTKDTVQVGDTLVAVAFREPSDRDEKGAGLTYWSL